MTQIKEQLPAQTPDSSIIAKNPYESQALMNQYLEFHYGEKEYFGVPNFPRRVANEAVKYSASKTKALDLGCAVGRTSFELATHFDEVIGLDYSSSFIRTCEQIRNDLTLSYKVTEEGEITCDRTLSLPSIGLSKTASKCHFMQGDAHDLAEHLSGFDLIICANLIDRLSDPAYCLKVLQHRLTPGGILFVCSPYTWLPEFTEPERWLGGYYDTQKNPVLTRDRLTEVLSELIPKEVKAPFSSDIPFVIRETARKYQHSISNVSVWQKPPK